MPGSDDTRAPASSPWRLPVSRQRVQALRGDCFHPARSIGQADLCSLQGAAAGWILKDFSNRPVWIRLLLSRRIARREVRALLALDALDGVPRFGGWLSPDAFAIERLDAERLPHLGVQHALDPAFFDRLASVVRRMHERGWAHGDLRRKNILIDRAQKPHLIDFATAIYGGPGSSFLRRRLFGHWALVDRITIARIKESYLPAQLTPEEREILARQPAYLRMGRWLKKNVYRPLKRRHRSELWRRVAAWLPFGRKGGRNR